MRVVIDTNVIISAFASKTGTPAQLFEKWKNQEFELILSSAILIEYATVFRYEKLRTYHRLNDAEISDLIKLFELQATFVEVSEVLKVILADPDDDKFLACAIAGNAEYIVSGDKHLLNLGIYQGIQILTPTNFLKMLLT